MDNRNFLYQTIFDNYYIIARMYKKTRNLIILNNFSQTIDSQKIYSLDQLLLEHISNGHIHEEDIALIYEFLNPIDNESCCSYLPGKQKVTFRAMANGNVSWFSLSVIAPKETTCNDSVLIMLRKLTQEEVDIEDSMNTMRMKMLKILKYNYTTQESYTILEPESEKELRHHYFRDKTNDEHWIIDKGMIHPEDVERVLNGTNLLNILNYFESGNHSFDLFYRRKVNNVFHWVHLTIRKSANYSNRNIVFWAFLKDVHQVFVDNFYSLELSGSILNLTSNHNSILELECFVHFVNFFTSKYFDCVLIDLKNDKYYLFKFNNSTLQKSIPYTASFSEYARWMIKNYFLNEDEPGFKDIADIKKLTHLLSMRSTLEYKFKSKNGSISKTVISRIESEENIPTKAICYTLPEESANRLRVKTFGNFQVFDRENTPLKFTRKQSVQLLAYLIDKQGFPSSTRDIVIDVLEKAPDDLNAIKYVSTLYRQLVKDLEAHGYTDVIRKQYNSLLINTEAIDCDYYHLMNGDMSYWQFYHNEYMKEYSWAETTNAEIMNYFSK